MEQEKVFERQDPAERKKEIEFIINWIKEYRLEKKINPAKRAAMELSCEAFGEGFNLLNRLIYTTDSVEWGVVNDNELRSLVLNEIERWEKKENQSEK